MKKVVAFCPAGPNNMAYFEKMKNSLRKFHSEEELPLIHVGEQHLRNTDQYIWYKMTPYVAKDLINEYETVIKLDADQVICGPINELWENPDFDVAVVNNSNPREFKTFPYQFLNIAPLAYVNCGLVVMRSAEMIRFWDNICNSILFQATQMKEQDWLNLLIYSNNYKVKHLDEGDSFWGLASKQYWTNIKLDGDRLVLPKNQEWPDKDKTIKVIHFAGGNEPNKMNFDIKFLPEVAKRLKELTHG